VRLLVAEDGAVRVEAFPLAGAPPRLVLRPPPGGAGSLRVAFAPGPVDRGDPFLFHKTTRRAVYERALAACPGCDEVLLWNEAGEVTEAATANIVARVGGALLTPPAASGLLPGTFRALLLERGVVRERPLTRAEVASAEALWLVNSVRGWRRCRLVERGRGAGPVSA
jgi:para-aminobenzoate synthetase/4-amino-4-deoxychorismate lyase